MFIFCFAKRKLVQPTCGYDDINLKWDVWSNIVITYNTTLILIEPRNYKEDFFSVHSG